MHMDLILWRHADAEDGMPDLERKLTRKGHKQAEAVARWLLIWRKTRGHAPEPLGARPDTRNNWSYGSTRSGPPHRS